MRAPIEVLRGKGRRKMKRWLVGPLVVGLFLGLGAAAGAETRDLVKFGGDVAIEEGMKVRDAVAIGGDVTVDGAVERNVVAVAGSVSLGPSATVGGNVVSIGGAIEKEEGAQVGGNLVEVPLPGVSSVVASLFQGNWPGFFWAFRLFSIIAAIGFMALALLIVSLIPRPVGLISATIEEKTAKVIGWGLLGMVLIMPLAILLAISIVGIVLIPLEMIFVVGATLIGYIAVAQLIGKRITAALRKPNQPIFWETLWGLIVLSLIGLVPLFGWLIKSVAGLLGLGGVLCCLYQVHKG